MPMEYVGDSEQRLEDLDKGKVCEEAIPYREAIGRLIYPMTGTRQDIAFAVVKLFKSCESPLEKHWNAVIRLF